MKKLLAMILAVAMVLSLVACGGASAPAPTQAAGDAPAANEGGDAPAAGPQLKSFRVGYIDTGSQDGTTTPLRLNMVAAIESVGAVGVPVQPAGSTVDDYLDAVDTMIAQGIDVALLPWVNFMFAGTPAAVKKCEDAGIYYGFYWGPEMEVFGEDTLSICQDSPLFLGAFYQREDDAAYNAMKSLYNAGCTQIGYIGLPASEEMQENSRDYGVEKGCKEFGQTILVEQRDSAMTLTAEGGATTVENFLTAYPEMDGIVICGNTQFVMPGVFQAIQASGRDIKVAAIDFPDDMKTYADAGVLVYDAGAHVTGPVYLTILAANAINGTPLIERGQSFNQQYIKLATSEEVSKWVDITNEIVYNPDEILQFLKVVNPEFDLEDFIAVVEGYSYADIMARHHSGE